MTKEKRKEKCDGIAADWKVTLDYQLFPQNERIDSSQYCSEVDLMKTEMDEKYPESVQRKAILFYQNNAIIVTI